MRKKNWRQKISCNCPLKAIKQLFLCARHAQISHYGGGGGDWWATSGPHSLQSITDTEVSSLVRSGGLLVSIPAILVDSHIRGSNLGPGAADRKH